VPRLYVAIVYGDQNPLPQRVQKTTEKNQGLPLMTLILGKQVFWAGFTAHACYRTHNLGCGFTVHACYRTHNLGGLTNTACYQTYVQHLSIDNSFSSMR
jgi:hypothetical protein